MKDYQFALTAIENCPDFNDFTHEEKGMLAVIAEVIDYKKGRQVFSMDKLEEKHFYILCSGKLALTLKDKKGPKKILTCGKLFGEIAVFSKKNRLGTIECLEDSVLLEFDKDKIMNRELISSQVALKICITLTEKIARYLYPDDELGIKDLIQNGEGETLEFKKGLNESKKSIVEAIAAFMNLKGGTILVGVEDDGNIIGMSMPSNKAALIQTRDQYQRKIIDGTKAKIDSHFLDLISFDWDNSTGRIIMRIDCLPAGSPVFYREKIKKEEKEYYFVRTGSENIKLSKTSEIVSHVIKKFKP